MSESLAVDTNTTSAPGGWLAWLVCLSTGLFFFYEFIQLNLFDVINQPLRESFQIDAAALGWMSSSFIWANVLFLLPAGFLLDRFSVKRVVLTAMAVCILGTIGFALTHSFVWASIFHACTGIGNAFAFLACVMMVSRWFPSHRQAFVIGCLVTMAFLGGMIAHTPLAHLVRMVGWRHALWFDAGLGAVLLVWMMRVVKDRVNTVPSRSVVKSGSFCHDMGHVWRNPQNWLAGLFTACLNLPIMVLCALWGASYLQEVYQLSAMTASHIVSMIFLGSMVGCPLAGWLSDRLKKRKPWMMIGALATILSVFPLLWGWHFSEMGLNGLFFAIGLFTSVQVISYPLIAESNSAQYTGMATSIASLIIMGGGGLGQLLFGFLMRFHAQTMTLHYTLADYQFAMWLFPMTALVALLAVFAIRETYCRGIR